MSDRELRLKILLDAMDKASGPIGDVRKESRLAGRAIGETRAELIKLNRAQADLKDMRGLRQGLGDVEKRMEAARSKAAAFARQIAQTDEPTAKLARDFEKAKREAAALGREFDQQRFKLHETGKRLREAGLSTANLTTSERRLAQQLRTTNAELDRRKAKFREIKAAEPQRLADARSAGDGGAGLGRAGAAVGVAAAYGAYRVGRDAVVEAAQYEAMLTSLGQKANFTREQSQRLGDTLRHIAPEVARLPQDMAMAADTLAGIGLLNRFDGIKDAEERFRAIEKATIEVTRVAGKAATAYGAHQDDMVRSIAAGVQNLEIPFEKAQRIADMMAAGGNAGSFELPAMSAELSSLTGAWGALGQTGEKALGQLIAGLETTRMLAGTDEEAANNLRNLILKLNSPETARNFAKAGINLDTELKKAKLEGRDLLEVIAELTMKATKGDKDKITSMFGDQQAMLAVTALITKMKEYKTIRADVMNSGGTVDSQFAERMNDQVSKMDRLKAQWSDLGVSIGKALKPLTDPAIDSATSKLEQIAANIRGGGLLQTAGAMLTGNLIPTEALKRIEAERARQDAIAAQHRAKSLANADRFKNEMRGKIGSTAEYNSIGSMMMQGLLMALNPAILAQRLIAIARNGIAAFKNYFGIKSPSRLFMGLGGYMTEGLALGVDRGAQKPLRSIGRLSAGVAGAMALASPAAAGPEMARAKGSGRPPAATSADTYHFHIQQQPGESMEDLAKRIMEIIKRTKRGESLGAYTDD